ncbi:TonB-dependent receptor [Luminiphilus syltensis NOR5-1B]|uniref:TonB-dependent receptor n=1 Tax=Luminiphilus syltensis NOR5-1B TaxID=565045 RepID=B8KXQ2_9GAMM|nr:TonB-dependent receptor [Luminiphilus syltensis]EED36952.1 TonB-dependent receptor [Luminiphilus syltensis NOR5-1B]
MSKPLSRKNFVPVTLASAIAALCWTQPTATFAQGATVLEEIVVTARKRGAEKLQDVPATITAFGSDQLQQMRALDFDSFAYQVPGLTFSDEGAGQKRYVLRGVRSAGQQQVAVYYDEIPLPGIQGAAGNSGSQTTDLKLFDLDRVEVLKGPQGTTFGANSQIGTLRFILNKPDMTEFGAKIQVGGTTVEEGDTGGSVYGMVNVPLIDDKLSFRAVGYYDDQPGYLDNNRLNREDYNWYETKGFRGMLRFQPNDRMTIDAMAWMQDTDAGGTDRYNPYDSFSDSPDNLDFVNNDLEPLEDIRNVAFFETGDLINGDFARTQMPDEQEIYSLTLNYDFDNVSLTAAGSYYDRSFDFRRDSTWVILRLGVRPEPTSPDDPPANRADLFPALTDQTQDVEQTAFEMRLNSTSDSRFQWMGGVFYRERTSDFRSYVPVVDEITGDLIDTGMPPTGFISGAPGEGIDECNPCVFARENRRKMEEIAVFGEVTYALNDQWELMAGLRWFEAEQTDNGLQLFPFALFPPENFLPEPDLRAFKEDKTISKFQVSYSPSDDYVFYGLASQGFRLGGTNGQGVVAVPPGYEADELWNYELGAKTTLADGRVNLNLAAFYIDWSDIQVAGQDPTGAFGFVGNAGAAEVLGLEFELNARPIDQLDLTAGFAWLPTRELSEDQISDQIVAPGRKGDKLPFVPEFTANAMAQYNFEVGGDWDGFIRGEFVHRGGSDSELDTTSRFNRKQNSYELFNFRAGVMDRDNGLNVTLYVENVFDERGDLRVRTEDSLLTVKWTTMPRTIGIDLTKTF